MAANSSEFKEELQKLEQKHADNPDGRYFVPLATAYRKAGETDRAIALLRQGLEGNGEYLSAHIVLGRCLADKGENDAARDEFDYVLQLDPQNLVALRSLGEMAMASGDYTDARQRWEQLLGVDPMNEDARRALEKLESAPAPETEASTAPPRTPAAVDQPLPSPVPSEDWEDEEPAGLESGRRDNAVVTETIAELYTRQGFYDRAVEVYRELLRRRGSDPDLEERLARVERLLAGTTADPGGSSPEPVGSSLEPVAPSPADPTPAFEPDPPMEPIRGSEVEADSPLSDAPSPSHAPAPDEDLVLEGYSAPPHEADDTVAPADEAVDHGTIGDFLAAVLSWTPGRDAAALEAPVAAAAPETTTSESEVPADDDLGLTQGYGMVEGFESGRLGRHAEDVPTSSAPSVPQSDPSTTPFGDDDLGLEPPLAEQAEPSAPARPAAPATPEPKPDPSPPAPTADGGEAEELSDDDLESFQEWLRSLKR